MNSFHYRFQNAYACFVRECLRRHITPVKRNFVSEEEVGGIQFCLNFCYKC